MFRMFRIQPRNLRPQSEFWTFFSQAWERFCETAAGFIRCSFSWRFLLEVLDLTLGLVSQLLEDSGRCCLFLSELPRNKGDSFAKDCLPAQFLSTLNAERSETRPAKEKLLEQKRGSLIPLFLRRLRRLEGSYCAGTALLLLCSGCVANDNSSFRQAENNGRRISLRSSFHAFKVRAECIGIRQGPWRAAAGSPSANLTRLSLPRGWSQIIQVKRTQVLHPNITTGDYFGEDGTVFINHLPKHGTIHETRP